jgi:tRNA threonylcarbamoyl adenosine modification protein YeaZ
MRLLAIDTALDACSVAVLDRSGDAERLTLLCEVLGRGHAERLMGMIGEVMAEASLPFAALDRIAVTAGPGSFTGLRVGLSAARGIALVVGAPAVGVGTLDALAEMARREAGEPCPVFAVLEAKGPEIYGQGFDADGMPLGEPVAMAAAGFARELPAGARLAGGGAAKLVAASGRSDFRILHEATWPDIASVARLGAAADPSARPPEPLYLRPPDAAPARRDERLLA